MPFGIHGERAAAGQGGFIKFVLRDSGRHPAHHLKTRRVETGLGTIFALQTILNHFELQGPDGCEQRDTLHSLANVQTLHHALLQELLQPFAETLEVGGGFTVEEGEALGSEAGNFGELDGGVFRQGVADAHVGVADDANHVAGKTFVDSFAFLAK